MNWFNWLFAVTAVFYLIGCWNSFRYYKNPEDAFDKRAVRWLGFGFLVQAATLLGEWIQAGYAPLTTLAGIFLILSLCLCGSLLVGRLKTPVPVLTSLFLPIISFLAVTAFFMSLNAIPLMEAQLMTTGMASHILLTFLGFACFTQGFGVAVAFWIQEGQLKQHQMKSWSYRLPALETLDSLTVFYIGLGFFLWMGGLGLGAKEAYQVWNRIPFADPKILGSFLVLVIYALFFLLRWSLRVRGRKSMMLVMAGYFLALFTFLGVRVFLTTQHVF